MPKVIVMLSTGSNMLFEDAAYKVNNDETLEIQQNGELVGYFPKGSYHHFLVERDPA